MRSSRFLLAFLASLCCSTAAFADTVFMVQLGSYDSPSEADSYWSNLVEENKKLLSGLTPLNSRISLPPANIEIIRLQAGPIANRVDAKRICAALNKEQEDCFVVETAMFVGDEAPTQMASFEEVDNAIDDIIEADEIIDIEDTAVIAVPELSAIAAAPVVSAATTSSSSVFANITNALFSPFSSNDDDAGDEISLVEEEGLLKQAEELAAIEVSDIEEEISKELENAVSMEMPSNNAIDELVTDSEERLSQITNEAALSKAPAATARKELPLDKRITRVRATSENLPAAVNPSEESLMAKLPVIAKPNSTIKAVTKNIPTAKIAVIEPELKTIAIPTPSVRSRSNLKSAVIIQQLPSEKTASEKSIIAPIVAANQGSIEVAEAIAVPLSNITASTEDAIVGASKPINAGLPTFKGRKPLGWRGTPSQSFLQKSLWIKLNYFKNEKSAQNYWRRLQNQYPTMTKNLRMRITKPYSKRKSDERTSMQLGPLLAYKDVQSLCKVASKPQLVCEVQRDTGVSTASRSRGVESGKAIQSRRDIANRTSTRRGGTEYWAQIGSYRNRGDAMKVWSELKGKHSTLKGKHPHLAHPAKSSSARTIYRLRTGPFSTRIAAVNLCAGLEASDTPCVVVNR